MAGLDCPPGDSDCLEQQEVSAQRQTPAAYLARGLLGAALLCLWDAPTPCYRTGQQVQA